MKGHHSSNLTGTWHYFATYAAPVCAVPLVLAWGLVSLPDALRMASLAPAKSVGIDHICGLIEEGRAADLIVVDDEGHLIATYLDGQKRFG